MKVKVCDVCKKDGVLTEANRRICFRRMTHYNIDVCDKHRNFVKGLDFDLAKKKVAKLLGYAEIGTLKSD